jgi:menaquinone-dependent protoporphyrinogen oxidase
MINEPDWGTEGGISRDYQWGKGCAIAHLPIHVFYSHRTIIPLYVKTMARILVAYASKKGSTAEIAQAIAKELQAAGHNADAVDITRGASPAGYDAAVIGGPMYVGKIDGVGKFVKRHSADLARIPVAGFVVCLAAAAKDTEGMVLAEKALHAALDPLKPVAETIFAGKLDPEKLSWFQRWITKKVKSPVGDFRDWAVITAWARELPGKMKI